MSKEVQSIGELDFECAVLRSEGAVLVDFTADWCPPCRALSPVVERVAAELGDRVRFYRVDADACPNLASRFKIRGLPTLVVFAEGREVARRLGLTHDQGVKDLLAGYAVSAERAGARG
jgi:thioredoxin 1